MLNITWSNILTDFRAWR